MRKLMVVALVATLSMLTACHDSHDESCEWEQKPKSVNSMTAPELAGKVGGTSGGRGGTSSGGRGSVRGGSSGGTGGKVNTNKAPRYNSSNPAPKPKAPARVGYVWSWDCD